MKPPRIRTGKAKPSSKKFSPKPRAARPTRKAIEAGNRIALAMVRGAG